MGYGKVSIVLYAVEIPEDIAAKIFRDNNNDDDEDYDEDDEDDEDYDEDEEEVLLFCKSKHYRKSTDNQRLPVTTYAAHDTGSSGSEVFYPIMVADGADSRIDLMEYMPGATHYLGIYIASKGYAYTDKINYFLNNPIPPEAIVNFNESIQPLLEQYGIVEKPQIVLAQQVW